MITIEQGDLLQSDCHMILHQCNCQGVMGSGIAAQIKKKFPVVYEEFLLDKRKPVDKLSTSLVVRTNTKPIMLVGNLYGQYDYGREHKVYTNYMALMSAMYKAYRDGIEILDHDYGLTRCDIKIGIPYNLGCGLANGNWNFVYEKIIKEITGMLEFKNTQTIIYKL